jgi:DNA-binding NarL/FixJ family response regulator
MTPMDSHPTLKVGVCDPSEISRVGIARSLAPLGIDIVAEAADLSSAVRLLGGRKLDAVLLDMDLPPAHTGVNEAIADAHGRGIPAIATAVDGSPARVLTAIRAGACGYLTKDLPPSAWAGSVRAAVRGEAAFSRRLTTALVDELRGHFARIELVDQLPSERRLTKREWQVLSFIADGRTNRDVADALCISAETVRTHVSNILAKLETPNRSAAAARYQQLRMVQG